ncbi:MAG: alpha-glucan phosphorylase, partial [Eubacterium sp.]|nr:alpha-glucan phosphorylase [Eubacterium sp.]
MKKMTVAQAKKAVSDKLSHFFGVDPKTATNEQYYKAVSMIVRDKLSEMNSEFRSEAKGQDSKEIYYLCMEFLMGRSLKNSLYNLSATPAFEKAVSNYGLSLEELYE